MAETIVMIDPRALKVHPRNAEFFDDVDGAEFDRLVESIKDHGVLTPLRVTKDMTIISGHQRVRAAIQAECFEVPVIVDSSEDENDVLMKLIETNFGRMKNDPIKQARWVEEYEKLRGVRQGSAGNAEPKISAGVTQDDIAKELGVSRDTLQNLKKLLKLDPALQALISEGKINASSGFKILSKLSPEDQQKLIEKLPKDEILSTKAVQEYIDQMRETFQANNSSIAQENDKLRGEKEKLKAENNELRSGALPISAEIQSEIDKLNQERRKYYEQSERLKKETERLRGEIEKANFARVRAETVAKGGDESNIELQNQIDDLMKQLEISQRKVNDLEFQLETKEDEVKKLMRDNKDKPFRTAITYSKDDPRTKERESESLRIDIPTTIGALLTKIREFNAVYNTSDLFDYFPLNQFEPLIQIVSDTQKELTIFCGNLMKASKKVGDAAKNMSEEKQSA